MAYRRDHQSGNGAIRHCFSASPARFRDPPIGTKLVGRSLPPQPAMPSDSAAAAMAGLDRYASRALDWKSLRSSSTAVGLAKQSRRKRSIALLNLRPGLPTRNRFLADPQEVRE